ncbi:transcriptional regulator [Methanobrevibacter sp. V74]|uniref:transcriptional regulator n=1 Tax=Methanobrevibacter sp. V74 TaxID=3064279 RepID=UPI0027333FCA|nr:transcriptional regulator [Methanobrevibacter sp. V74]
MGDETLKFLQRSKYRPLLLKSLENEVLMPKEISQHCGIRISHVSKVLAELKSKELIEILNPEEYKGRLYRLSDKGIYYLKKLDE